MTPGFSLRRVFNHRRYFYTRVALDPQQTLDLCIEYWMSTGTWEETLGMCEQLAQQGQVGTEVATGSDAWHIVVSSALDEILPFGVFPPAAPCNVKRVRQKDTPILIASCSCSVAGRPANRLWCYEARALRDKRWGTDTFIDISFRELVGDLRCQGLLLEVPRFFHDRNLPKDHLFTRENVLSMRETAKKESRRKR